MLVEVWSDVVCPWCAIGRERLIEALDGVDGAADIDVRWRSFELDPTRAATTDVPYVEMLAGKYRTSTSKAQAMIDRMTAAGAEEGIEFRFDVARPGNTFDAHRLLHLAADRGRQHELKARLLAGYHSEGEPIADHAALTRMAVDAGLAEDEVTEVLASDRYAAEVRADEQRAYDYGITGVPFFVLDGAVGVAGAQPAEVLRAAIEDVRAGAHRPAEARAHDGHDHPPDEDCVDGVCTV